MHFRLLCAGTAICVPWTVASNPCAEANSYDSEGIIDGIDIACGSVVPSLMEGVTISAETCAEVIDPLGHGENSRTTYLSYAAASCCSGAGSVCSAFAGNDDDNPCAEANSYDSNGIIDDAGACGNVVPSVMDGVAISAETCAEVIDPFGEGDFTRSTMLSYAAAACCSDAGSVCSVFAARLCDDPSSLGQPKGECLNWQTLLGQADTEGDAAAWCAEEVLGPSVSCTGVSENCLWMARSIVTAFSHSDCCNAGGDICEDAVPISTCTGAQSRWYGLGGSCPEECHGDGDDEVCTRSPNTCGTAGCEAYLSRFTMQYTEELTSGMLKCDSQRDVYILASKGAEHVHADVLDIADQCGLSDAVPGIADNASSDSDSVTVVLTMPFLIPCALLLAHF